jgi:CRISPR-associated endonuclease/helicase Cas3
MKYHTPDEVNGDSRILIEGWNSEFICTTFNQLFETIISNSNNKIRKFHNIVNSILILDEIQSIPYEYYQVINKVLKKLSEDYNVYIIIMTATQPLLFEEKEIKSLVHNTEYYYNQFNRITYHFHHNQINLKQLSNMIKDDLKTDNDIMLVLNTIKSSVEIYNQVKDLQTNHEIIYLSSNITPIERLERINHIKEYDGPKLIITTQLIEAGVDISVDKIYRDIAPLDSIIQTAGRCNRNNTNSGEVHVIKLINGKRKLYAGMVYDSVSLSTTIQLLKRYDKITEKEFTYTVTKKYYTILKQTKKYNHVLEEDINKSNYLNVSNEFQLIKKENQIPLYICINNEAEKIFNAYEEIIRNYNGYIRKEKFNEIKNQFYQYVINIYENELEEDSIEIINDEIGVIRLKDYYNTIDKVVGFK